MLERIVLEFEVDRAFFHWWGVHTKFSEKVEYEEYGEIQLKISTLFSTAYRFYTSAYTQSNAVMSRSFMYVHDASLLWENGVRWWLVTVNFYRLVVGYSLP